MRISGNSTALSASVELDLNTQVIEQLSQHLSSGRRINSAADDPSGLAISENTLANSRGAGMAVQNIQDTISLLQTAEGGMRSIVDAIQRIRVLALQAANDTYTIDQRQHIQLEVDQLKAHIQQVARTTQFNGTSLLDGAFDISFAPAPTRIGTYLIDSNLDFQAGSQIMTMLVTPRPGASQIGYNAGTTVVNLGFFADTNMDVLTRLTNSINAASSGVNANLLVNGLTHAIQTSAPLGVNFSFQDGGAPPGTLALISGLNNQATITSGRFFEVQAGANAQDTIPLIIPNMTLESLGLSDLNVITSANAESAIGNIDKAVVAAGGDLASVGASESRLGQAQFVEQNTSDNLLSSYSGLVNADISHDASLLASARLTQQTGQAVLARSVTATYGMAVFTVNGLRQRFPTA